MRKLITQVTQSPPEAIIRMVIWIGAGILFRLLLVTVSGRTIALNDVLLGGTITGVVAGLAGSIINRLWAAVVEAIVFGVVIGMIYSSITLAFWSSMVGFILGVIIEPIVGDNQGRPDVVFLLRVLSAIIGAAIGILVGLYTATIVESLFKSNAWQIVIGLVGAIVALVLFDWLLVIAKKTSQ